MQNGGAGRRRRDAKSFPFQASGTKWRCKESWTAMSEALNLKHEIRVQSCRGVRLAQEPRVSRGLEEQ